MNSELEQLKNKSFDIAMAGVDEGSYDTYEAYGLGFKGGYREALTAYRARLLAEIEKLMVPGPTTDPFTAGGNTTLAHIKAFIEKEQND